MFPGPAADVKGGVGQRHQREHLAVVVHRDALRGAGRGPAVASRVDHDAQRPQPAVGVEGAVAAQPLRGHVHVAQDAPGHVGVDRRLELQEEPQRPPRAVAVSDPPDRVGTPSCAVVDPLAGDVGERREVEQRGDFREEAPEQVLDDDGQREELLPRGVVASPRGALGHLGAPCNMRLQDTLAAGSHRRKWTKSRRVVGHRRSVALRDSPEGLRPARHSPSRCAVGSLTHSHRSVTGYCRTPNRRLCTTRISNRSMLGPAGAALGIDAAHPVECGALASRLGADGVRCVGPTMPGPALAVAHQSSPFNPAAASSAYS